MVIKYEDLKNPDLKFASLTKLVMFLGLPLLDSRGLEHEPPETNGSARVPTSIHTRIDCAYLLADNPRTHRRRDLEPRVHQLKDQEETNTRSAAGKAGRYLTKDEVYDRDTVCEMWADIGGYASKQGYHPYKGFECTRTVIK
jgi:hypothetical protein